MKSSYLAFVISIILISGCSHRVTTSLNKTYPPLDNKKDVSVLTMEQQIPNGAEILGEVKIGDSGFSTNCGYDVAIYKAKLEARKVGGHAIKIINHTPPSILGSTCHRLKASIIRLENIDENEIKNSDYELSVGTNDYSSVRLALNGGYSNLTAKISDQIPSNLKNYIREIKSGFHIGGDLSFFISEYIGFGAKYSLFRSSNSIPNINYTDVFGYNQMGTMEDKIITQYIGPSYTSRLFNIDKSNAFLMGLSIGYLGYHNKKTIGNTYNFTGSTIGFVIDLGYDIEITEQSSLGFQVSLLSGNLTEFEVSSGGRIEKLKLEKGNYEGLGRVDFSVGLRFNL